MKISLKDSSFSVKLSLIAAILGLVSFVAFLIYGAVYSVYADWAVALFLILGAACYLGYALLDNKFAELLPLIGVVLTGIGFNLFFLNSYNVWADWYGNFNMYGSEGGIAPVIVQMVLDLLTIIAGIIACFTSKQKKGEKEVAENA